MALCIVCYMVTPLARARIVRLLDAFAEGAYRELLP